MTTELFPDALPDIRAYLRTNQWTQPVVEGRVFLRIPAKDPASPFLRLYRTGGGTQANSESPLQDIRVAIDVWGTTFGYYPLVRKAVRMVEQMAAKTPQGTKIGKTTTLLNINVTTAVDSPDPTTGWPRVVMDSIWTVRRTGGT